VKELDRPITQEEKRHLMLNAAVRFKEINDILATVPSRALSILLSTSCLSQLLTFHPHPQSSFCC